MKRLLLLLVVLVNCISYAQDTLLITKKWHQNLKGGPTYGDQNTPLNISYHTYNELGQETSLIVTNYEGGDTTHIKKKSYDSLHRKVMEISFYSNSVETKRDTLFYSYISDTVIIQQRWPGMLNRTKMTLKGELISGHSLYYASNGDTISYVETKSEHDSLKHLTHVFCSRFEVLPDSLRTSEYKNFGHKQPTAEFFYQYNETGKLMRKTSIAPTDTTKAIKDYVYDEKGRILQEISYRLDDTTQKTISYTYTAKGDSLYTKKWYGGSTYYVIEVKPIGSIQFGPTYLMFYDRDKLKHKTKTTYNSKGYKIKEHTWYAPEYIRDEYSDGEYSDPKQVREAVTFYEYQSFPKNEFIYFDL